MAGKQRRRSGELRSTERRRTRKRSRELIFPAELLEEILVRLPIKSVLRFESVSKEWLSNFRSTLFKELYEQRNNSHKPENVYMMKLEDLYRMVPTLQRKIGPPKPLDLRYKISSMGPLNNAICCIISVPIHTSSNTVYCEGCQIVLCNPATSQFNLLPPYPSKFLINHLQNGPVWQVVCGFGTVPGCLDYRVVLIVVYGVAFDSILVLVYSSSSGEWERLVDYIPEKKIVGPSNATEAFTRGQIWKIIPPHEVCPQRLLNGRWHWMTRQYEKARVTRYGGFIILSFDLAHQSFDLINGLPEWYERRHVLCPDVVVLHNHLAVVGLYIWTQDVSVWMMMDYGVEESWTNIFKVHLFPSYAGGISSLYRIDYSVDVEEEDGSDNVFIERLSFISKGPRTRDIISFDRHGGHQASPFCHDVEDIFLNTGGISRYKETLERPF